MSTAIAERKSQLHDALAAANDAARVATFARATGCEPCEVADEAGQLNILRVFAAMRRHGYQVDTPVQQRHRSQAGDTLWTVRIGLPGASATLAYYAPAPKHPNKLENHA